MYFKKKMMSKFFVDFGGFETVSHVRCVCFFFPSLHSGNSCSLFSCIFNMNLH